MKKGLQTDAHGFFALLLYFIKKRMPMHNQEILLDGKMDNVV